MSLIVPPLNAVVNYVSERTSMSTEMFTLCFVHSGNILQIVSAPGQQIIRPQGSMVMQALPQTVPTPNAVATPGTPQPALSTSQPGDFFSFYLNFSMLKYKFIKYSQLLPLSYCNPGRSFLLMQSADQISVLIFTPPPQ